MAESQSRNEAILQSIINSIEYADPPQSRLEDLLLQLKEAIESGGGGSSSLLPVTTEDEGSVLAVNELGEWDKSTSLPLIAFGETIGALTNLLPNAFQLISSDVRQRGPVVSVSAKLKALSYFSADAETSILQIAGVDLPANQNYSSAMYYLESLNDKETPLRFKIKSDGKLALTLEEYQAITLQTDGIIYVDAVYLV